MKIGKTYSGAGTTAIEDDLIVEGSAGIGTATPDSSVKLDVAGDIKTSGGIILGGERKDKWPKGLSDCEWRCGAPGAPAWCPYYVGTTTYGRVACPAGKIIVSGGCNVVYGSYGSPISSSMPEPHSNCWFCRAASGEVQYMYAFCCKQN
jgi:hypothetical protein